MIKIFTISQLLPGYRLSVSESESRTVIIESVYTSTETSTLLENLGAGFLYEISLVALGKKEEDNSVETAYSFSTEKLMPRRNQPVNLEIVEVRSTEATVTWPEPYYNVSRQTIHFGEFKLFPNGIGQSERTYTIRKLKPRQSYLIRIEVEDEFGIISEEVDPIVFTTVQDWEKNSYRQYYH